MNNKEPSGCELLLSDARGIYIPRDFAESCDLTRWNVSDEDADILRAGPDHEHYWDAWSDVLDSAEFKTDSGAVYRLYQDGDLWAYCRDRMTPEEQVNFFGEYEAPEGITVYMIGDHFASAIEYGDETGLTDEESAQLAEFMRRESPDHEHQWTTEPALSGEFNACEITGMRGTLTGLLLVDMRKPATGAQS